MLPDRDQMIHQLAARKTAKELEEGRGWIYHAKDFYTGDLLKDKHRGCFSDLVKGKAVRLGTTYQVVGKWCSFVAVEGGDEGKEDRKTTGWEGIPELPADYLPQPWIGSIRDISELPSYSSSTLGVSEIHGKEYSPTERFKSGSRTNGDQYPLALQNQGAAPMPGGGYQTGVENHSLSDMPPVGDAPVSAAPCYTAGAFGVSSSQVTKSHPLAMDQTPDSDLDLLLGDTNKSTMDSQKTPPGNYNIPRVISRPPKPSSGKLFETIDLHNELERDFMPSDLTARDFSRCREPWALGAIQAWLQDVAGGGLDLRIKDVEDALRHLFTAKTRKIKVAEARALSNQVVAPMLRAHALIPDEEWVIFGHGKVSGVLWQMTGSGCYAPRLNRNEMSGRCYHSRCALGL
ncbi:unnamed protein product [Clonostachys rosea]|uniref:RGF3 winged helix domain-containing protein n=1 Tax=Bionectria ochroleuca TaxID=29856 RepID=A0ABY6UE31_BIOOC|nr:unnamed protein product [Clonostachys rosea]